MQRRSLFFQMSLCLLLAVFAGRAWSQPRNPHHPARYFSCDSILSMSSIAITDAYEILAGETNLDLEWPEISEVDQMLEKFSSETFRLLAQIDALKNRPISKERRMMEERLTNEVRRTIIITQALKTMREDIAHGGLYWLN